MTMITWPDVLAFAPGLSTVNATAQGFILEYSNAITIAGATDMTLRLAQIYLAAHLGSSLPEGGASVHGAGGVASESAGGLSRSFATAISDALVDFGTTSFGRGYLAIIRGTEARIPIAG